MKSLKSKLSKLAVFAFIGAFSFGLCISCFSLRNQSVKSVDADNTVATWSYNSNSKALTCDDVSTYSNEFIMETNQTSVNGVGNGQYEITYSVMGYSSGSMQTEMDDLGTYTLAFISGSYETLSTDSAPYGVITAYPADVNGLDINLEYEIYVNVPPTGEMSVSSNYPEEAGWMISSGDIYWCPGGGEEPLFGTVTYVHWTHCNGDGTGEAVLTVRYRDSSGGSIEDYYQINNPVFSPAFEQAEGATASNATVTGRSADTGEEVMVLLYGAQYKIDSSSSSEEVSLQIIYQGNPVNDGLNISADGTTQLGVNVYPENTEVRLQWETSDPELLEVDSDGLLNPIGVGGPVTVTVSDLISGVFARASVYIEQTMPSDPSGSLESLQIIYNNEEVTEGISIDAGQSIELSVDYLPTTADVSLSWRSSEDTIATVEKTGDLTAVVTGVSEGYAIIYVDDSSGKNQNVLISVTGQPVVEDEWIYDSSQSKFVYLVSNTEMTSIISEVAETALYQYSSGERSDYLYVSYDALDPTGGLLSTESFIVVSPTIESQSADSTYISGTGWRPSWDQGDPHSELTTLNIPTDKLLIAYDNMVYDGGGFYYKEEGYPNAQTTLVSSQYENGIVSIFYEIELSEGGQTGTRQVDITPTQFSQTAPDQYIVTGHWEGRAEDVSVTLSEISGYPPESYSEGLNYDRENKAMIYYAEGADYTLELNKFTFVQGTTEASNANVIYNVYEDGQEWSHEQVYLYNASYTVDPDDSSYCLLSGSWDYNDQTTEITLRLLDSAGECFNYGLNINSSHRIVYVENSAEQVHQVLKETNPVYQGGVLTFDLYKSGDTSDQIFTSMTIENCQISWNQEDYGNFIILGDYNNKSVEIWFFMTTRTIEGYEFDIKTITITSDVQTEYQEGDYLNLEGLTIKVVYENNDNETITEGFETNIPLDEPLTGDITELIISYKGVSAEPIELFIQEATPEVIEVSIDTYPRTEYTVGECLDLSNLSLRVGYADGTMGYVTTGYETSIPLDQPLSENDSRLVITYGGFSVPISLSVTSEPEQQFGFVYDEANHVFNYLDRETGEHLEVKVKVIVLDYGADSEETRADLEVFAYKDGYLYDSLSETLRAFGINYVGSVNRISGVIAVEGKEVEIDLTIDTFFNNVMRVGLNYVDGYNQIYYVNASMQPAVVKPELVEFDELNSICYITAYAIDLSGEEDFVTFEFQLTDAVVVSDGNQDMRVVEGFWAEVGRRISYRVFDISYKSIENPIQEETIEEINSGMDGVNLSDDQKQQINEKITENADKIQDSTGQMMSQALEGTVDLIHSDPDIADKQKEVIVVVLETAIEVDTNKTSDIGEAKKVDNSLPSNSDLNVENEIREFYERQMAELLGRGAAPTRAKTRAASSGYQINVDVGEKTGQEAIGHLDNEISLYGKMMDFIDNSVSHMGEAALKIRQCSGESVKISVKNYVTSVKVSSFRDFDKEAADAEFLENVYKAIMLHMQEQVINTLESEHKDSGNKEKEEVYQNELAAVKDYETFEIMVTEVLRQKYVALTGDETYTQENLENFFNDVYWPIFRAWALDEDIPQELKDKGINITLEQLTTTTIEQSTSRARAFTVHSDLQNNEIIFLAALGGGVVLTISLAAIIPTVINKRRRGLVK